MARRLALGTAAILGILLLYGVYVIDRIENLASQTARIYEHPFEVQQAVLEAKVAYIKIHRAMKDITLSVDDSEILARIRSEVIALQLRGESEAARDITVPLASLTEAAERIRGGEFDHRAEVTAQNKLGTLARSFNSMVDDLDDQTRTIEKQRDETQQLLLNILPELIADRIKSGETTIADSFAGGFEAEARGEIEIKGRGSMPTYLLQGEVV